MSYTVYEVIKRLIGHIRPAGETYRDTEGLKNLYQQGRLIDKLVEDMAYVAKSHTRKEASMKGMGIFAKKYLTELKETLAAYEYALEEDTE